MPTINNYPNSLLDEHSNWHMHPGHPELGGRAFLMGSPGSGLEFLTFHRAFLVHFHTWYDAQSGAYQAAVAPWTAIPPELKTPAAGWNSTWAGQETQITTNTPPFATADALGIFIETGIHNNFLHNAAGTVYNEPLLFNPMTSPESTHFYQLHGLITNWWNHWASLQKGLGKEVIDNKHHQKDFIKDKDVIDKSHQKEFINDKFIIDTKHLQKEAIKDFKEIKEKDIFEGPGPFIPGGDPMAPIQNLTQRVARLEQSAGQAFIRPEERPNVGARAARPDKPKRR
jgi:hypothetical protein